MQRDFNKDYLSEKLQLIGEKLGDSYGQPLLDELIKRMERTVAHFNDEVDIMLKTIKSRTKNQRGLLASMRGEEAISKEVKLSKLEKKLEIDINMPEKSEVPKRKKFLLFRRKSKK